MQLPRRSHYGHIFWNTGNKYFFCAFISSCLPTDSVIQFMIYRAVLQVMTSHHLVKLTPSHILGNWKLYLRFKSRPLEFSRQQSSQKDTTCHLVTAPINPDRKSNPFTIQQQDHEKLHQSFSQHLWPFEDCQFISTAYLLGFLLLSKKARLTQSICIITERKQNSYKIHYNVTVYCNSWT